MIQVRSVLHGVNATGAGTLWPRQPVGGGNLAGRPGRTSIGDAAPLLRGVPRAAGKLSMPAAHLHVDGPRGDAADRSREREARGRAGRPGTRTSPVGSASSCTASVSGVVDLMGTRPLGRTADHRRASREDGARRGRGLRGGGAS